MRLINLNSNWPGNHAPKGLGFILIIYCPKIAGKMDLSFEKEMSFRVDGTFYKTASQTSRVPIILLESENDAFSSHGEFNKLCLLNAPLKVLMICNDWNDASKKMLTEKYWGYIIEDFAEESSLSGYFAIIIGEWNETLNSTLMFMMTWGIQFNQKTNF